MLKHHYRKYLVKKMIVTKNEEFDRSEDFSPEELCDEEPEYRYESLEDKLREVGMSIRDFI